jgi:two-component sensor histidine kinase
VLEVFRPDPPPAVAEFVAAVRTSLEAVISTRGPDQMAVRAYAVQTADGGSDERYWSATNTPILGADGAVTHIVSAVQDVTGEVLERRSEDARKLLMREVDHRARNALTVVQSFVRLTTASSLGDFRRVVDGRVEALARAQTSLAARRWEGASLHDVVEGELAALSQPGKYTVSGPQILLRAGDVQAMSMVIHELATNASKYGALSTEGGTLTIAWDKGAAGGMTLVWSEEGGPRVEPPSREGFGSRLVSQLTRQLGGEIAYAWRADGLRAELSLPLGDG